MRKLNIAPPTDVLELYRQTHAISTWEHTHVKPNAHDSPPLTDIYYGIDLKNPKEAYSVEVPGHLTLRPGDEVEVIIRRRRREVENEVMPERKIVLSRPPPQKFREQRVRKEVQVVDRYNDALPPARAEVVRRITEGSVIRASVRMPTGMVQSICRVIAVIPSTQAGAGAYRVMAQSGHESTVGVQDIHAVMEVAAFAPEGARVDFYYGHERKNGLVLGVNEVEGKFVVGSGRRADYAVELRQIFRVQTSEEYAAERARNNEPLTGIRLVVAGYLPVNVSGSPQGNVKLVTALFNPVTEELQDFHYVDAHLGRTQRSRPYMEVPQAVQVEGHILTALRSCQAGTTFQVRENHGWSHYQTMRKLTGPELRMYDTHPVMGGRPDPDGNREPVFSVHFRPEHVL